MNDMLYIIGQNAMGILGIGFIAVMVITTIKFWWEERNDK